MNELKLIYLSFDVMLSKDNGLHWYKHISTGGYFNDFRITPSDFKSLETIIFDIEREHNYLKNKDTQLRVVVVSAPDLNIVVEHVFFVPDVTLDCTPPYMTSEAWVKYHKGDRPKDRSGWENILGMSIQTML
jgi:hypothetical protein